jgi:hypothetical protein
LLAGNALKKKTCAASFGMQIGMAWPAPPEVVGCLNGTMQQLDVLLVNPPIYDFTAYDFWLRPYGMMRVAGQMQHSCRLTYFDYLATTHKDSWGRGRLEGKIIAKPKALRDIPRHFRRFGKPRAEFRELLQTKTFHAVLIQTSMTYWYPGIQEVIDDIRELQPLAKIVLGGVYATLCTTHAQSLGSDLVIVGSGLEPLWRLLSINPQPGPPHQAETATDVGIIKLSDGCPFRCTYCSAPIMWPGFMARPIADCLSDLHHLIAAGVKNIAFYDDALLYRAEQVLLPFLAASVNAQNRVHFHTPNALNARFMTPELAQIMVQAGFASFFFGLESRALSWQDSTGGKVHSEEFVSAVNYLRAAGAESIFAYIIAGHPDSDAQELEHSIHFAYQCGVKSILSDFSPIPGTVDGEKCSQWADLAEPLSHNKTAFAIRRLGFEYSNRIKRLNHHLNAHLNNNSLKT